MPQALGSLDMTRYLGPNLYSRIKPQIMRQGCRWYNINMRRLAIDNLVLEQEFLRRNKRQTISYPN